MLGEIKNSKECKTFDNKSIRKNHQIQSKQEVQGLQTFTFCEVNGIVELYIKNWIVLTVLRSGNCFMLQIPQNIPENFGRRKRNRQFQSSLLYKQTQGIEYLKFEVIYGIAKLSNVWKLKKIKVSSCNFCFYLFVHVSITLLDVVST